MLFKKSMTCLLVTSLLFTVACGAKETGGKTAKGRFVEEIFDYPEDAYVMEQVLNEDNALSVYLLGKESGEYSLYETKDGKVWDKQEMPWILSEEELIKGIAYGPDGLAYLLTTTYLHDVTVDHIYQGEADGSLHELPIDWSGGHVPKYGTMVNQLGVLANGDLVIGQSYEGVVQYGSDGSYKGVYNVAKDTWSFAVSGNFIYLWNDDTIALQVYDGDTLKQTKNMNFEYYTQNTKISTGQNGVIYLYNNNGLFRLLPEGSMFEKIIDGEQSSLSLPAENFSRLVETGEGVFYLCSKDSIDNCRLYRYRYDETVAARPSEELTVYTLYENPLLRQAATYYHRQYPNIKVDIQVGMNGGSASPAEVVRALNTELLAGKGPDLLFLDGMNAENYIAKGVLMDITDLVKELSGQSPMIESVVNTLKSKGKLYAVPTRFLLPVYYTAEKNLAEVGDFDSFVAFAQKHAEKGVIGNKAGKNLMKTLMTANGQTWISKEGLDEGKLKHYLEGIKVLAETEATAYSPQTEDLYQQNRSSTDTIFTAYWKADMDDFFHWAYGRAHGAVDLLSGFDSFSLGFLAMEKVDGGTVTYLPGDAAKLFIPADIAAINVNTEKTEPAKNFLRLLLSSELQQVDLERGFPVNIEGLHQSMTERSSMRGISNATAPGVEPAEVLGGGWPDLQAQEKIRDLCLAVETPHLIDPILTDMVLQEAEGYFDGEKTVEEAIKDIKERTRIYLSE